MPKLHNGSVLKIWNIKVRATGFTCMWDNRCLSLYVRKRAPSEDSDQPALSRSLIRIFTRRYLDSQWCKVSSCGQRRLWSDCADAQADLSLRWALMSVSTFSHVATVIMIGMLCSMKLDSFHANYFFQEVFFVKWKWVQRIDIIKCLISSPLGGSWMYI